MKKILVLFIIIFSGSYTYSQQKIEPKIKEFIYDFIYKEDPSSKLLDWDNKEELERLIYIELRERNIQDIEVYFFRVTISPSKAYLLIKQQSDEGFVIGKKNKNMFDEMEELYDYLNCSERNKIIFLKSISETLFFIYENNLEDNSNRIMVDGEFIKE